MATRRRALRSSSESESSSVDCDDFSESDETCDDDDVDVDVDSNDNSSSSDYDDDDDDDGEEEDDGRSGLGSILSGGSLQKQTKNNNNNDGVVVDRFAASSVVPYDCGISDYPRVVHDAITWRFLQDAYLETVDDWTYRFQNDAHPSYSGFRVAFEVKPDDTKGNNGRTVYAGEPIQKGTAIWEPVHEVRFGARKELLEFLGVLDHDLKCDVLLLAHQDRTKRGVVSLALDPSSFVNPGTTKAESNLDGMLVATRDIRTGEELLFDNHYLYPSNTASASTTTGGSGGGRPGTGRTLWFDQMKKRAWSGKKAVKVDLSLGEGIDESEIKQLLILMVGIVVFAFQRYLPAFRKTPVPPGTPLLSPRIGRKSIN